jgi:type IV pilus assembly protein PilV
MQIRSSPENSGVGQDRSGCRGRLDPHSLNELMSILESVLRRLQGIPRSQGLKQRTAQDGMVFIEVLVSLVILAVGLLGIAGMQTLSLRNTQSAYQRTQATILSNDIAERLRATLREGDDLRDDKVADGDPPLCEELSHCLPAAMVAHEIAQWRQALAATLPAGDGVLCADASPDDGMPAAPACDEVSKVFAIKIWWDSDRDGQVDNRHSVSFQP